MLKLVQTQWGTFDLAFDDPAANDIDAAARTLIYAALFTDSPAPAWRVADPYDRSGWWEDALLGRTAENQRTGCGLWHVRRQPLTPSAKREAISMVERALATVDPALTEIVVSESPSDGNNSLLWLEIAGRHNGRPIMLKVPLYLTAQ